MTPAHRQSSLIPAVLIPALCVGQLACATNPVSGSRELRLTSQASEIRIGKRYYEEALLKQGGDFSVDIPTSEYVTEIGGQEYVQGRSQQYGKIVVMLSGVTAAAMG